MSESVENVQAYVLATAAYNYGMGRAEETLSKALDELGMKVGYVKSPIRQSGKTLVLKRRQRNEQKIYAPHSLQRIGTRMNNLSSPRHCKDNLG